MPNIGLPSARAAASRRNGAKSSGPKTAEGKARSAQNALKHGLRAQKYVVLPDEDAAAFEALEAALMEELAPDGALQTVLAKRVVAASWRLERAERLEAELFAHETYEMFGKADLGLALIRDCNGAGAFDTLLRYRGGTLAELWRALRTLKALQAEGAAKVAEPSRAPASAPTEQPDEPERRKNPGDSERARSPGERNTAPLPLPLPGGGAAPIEPGHRRSLAESAPPRAGRSAQNGSASLLAGTALVPADRRHT